MKLGCHYNAFDALDLLGPSINSIRTVVDFVCVVYQEMSNFGEAMSDVDRLYLDKLKLSGKVDMFYCYEPTSHSGHMNELAKRNLGKSLCANAGCDLHMSMDVDEFYVTTQLQYVKDQMSTGEWDASACNMQTYWKSPSFVLDPPEKYYVPIIYKMDDRTFDLRNRWNIPADPTRRLVSNRIRIFERSEIEMHHMSTVRLNYRSKLMNSSASINFKNKIDYLVLYHENWKFGMKALMPGMEDKFYNVKEVQNYFNII
ncbi:MAG: hypothetical protein COU25_00035 [Candidatus Levybacteria bacterium CG10_big_fil_rev_8_21_14_0_10_35_13]|nr:MAG: hypothetical protein COU25_00035 [Candidatus Levybacteria bacterium CG10_big_fil_rev_8_21_14_0_10_35_13]